MNVYTRIRGGVFTFVFIHLLVASSRTPLVPTHHTRVYTPKNLFRPESCFLSKNILLWQVSFECEGNVLSIECEGNVYDNNSIPTIIIYGTFYHFIYNSRLISRLTSIFNYLFVSSYVVYLYMVKSTLRSWDI